MHISEDYEVLSIHKTEEEARFAGQVLVHVMNGLPPGWALSIVHDDDDDGYELVRYQI